LTKTEFFKERRHQVAWIRKLTYRPSTSGVKAYSHSATALVLFLKSKSALWGGRELGQTRENSQYNAQWRRSRWVSFGSFVKKHHQ